MNPSPYQGVPVTCPNCKTRFRAPVMPIVDVGLFPQAKALLLSGQLNVAVCPNCGNAGMLQTPLVYHDPEKELLLAFVPPELGMSEMEQQRIVGDLTNRVMMALPAEKRKGYLLRPRTYLRLEALIKDVLEAEGITQEMMDAQRARVNLLDRLMHADGEAVRKSMAQANDEMIDYDFMDLLSVQLEAAERTQQAGLVEELSRLRHDLMQWTTVGREMAEREEAIQSLGPEVTREKLLEKLVEAALAGQEVKIETMIAVARPALDYVFFQQLSEMIGAADQSGDRERAEKLRALRETALDITAQMDQEAQQVAEQTRQLLQEALEAEDAEAWIRGHATQIDDLFMGMLSANLQAAQRAGQTAAADRLQRLSEALTNLLLEGQPPEIRLINRLLNADYPEETRSLLEENRALIDERMVGIMEQLADDLRGNGREEPAERLSQIREQARQLIGLI